MERPTTATIDLDSLAYNYRSVRRFVGSPGRLMAVVKADAYGHGAVECSRRLEKEGVEWFGVALLEEAIELRRNDLGARILCFGGVWPGTAEAMLKERITPVVFDIEHARAISSAAGSRGETARIHVKIDTGMGRVGIPAGEAAAFAESIAALPFLEVEGIMGHLSSADDPRADKFTTQQIECSNEARRAFESKGLSPEIMHTANSPGAVAFSNSRQDMVRIGGLLYGLGDDVLPPNVRRPELRPVMSISTRIAQIKRVPAGTSIGYGRTFVTERESLIGTIPAGYHDGYPRVLSNKARVLVSGEFAPVAGRISMDWTTIDLTDVPGAGSDSDVVLIGSQGGNSILAEDLAADAGTISYEITCGISRRVRRVYKN